MFLSLLLSMIAAPVDPGPVTAQTEMLGINAPDEFEIGYQARNQEQQIIELVQPPETVENWSKLITSQMMFDAAKKVTAETFYGRWRESMRQACAGMTDTAIRGTVDGKPAIKGALACPLNPQTGKPENLVVVLVEGEANLMMVQVAIRHTIVADDGTLIGHITGSLKVCDQRALSACSARKATGFVPAAK